MMSKPPVTPRDPTPDARVVDIGDIRVARGLTRRPVSSCRHRRMLYDTQERRVWCQDCETELEPFDAFACLVEQVDVAQRRLKVRGEAVAQAEKFTLRSRAARALDEIWRSRKMAPACPHCGKGIEPQDVIGKLRTVLRRRAKPD